MTKLAMAFNPSEQIAGTYTHTAIVPVHSKGMLTSARLQKRVRELVQSGATNILFNLEGLVDIDSTGIGVLVGWHISLAIAGGTFVLMHVSPRIRELLEINGLSDVFAIREESSTVTDLPDDSYDLNQCTRSEVYVG